MMLICDCTRCSTQGARPYTLDARRPATYSRDMDQPYKSQGEFEEAIQLRINALMKDRQELLRRFDFDGNGEIDAFEMNAIRHIVSEEVLAEWEGDEEPTLEILDNNLAKDRYKLISELGHGSQGSTLLARDTHTHNIVAIKRVDFAAAEDWKAVELFEREVEVLKALDHPAIPDFVDAFEDPDNHHHYLVQEFIPGETLAALIADGYVFTEDAVIDILQQMLNILEYLHTRVPVVLHRDIKPGNIIMTPDDRVFLVDFGAVQHKSGRGTTVIGTTGYMPQEQLTGRAEPASDIYGLGATLVHVITGKHPGLMDTHRMHIQWRERSNINPYVTGLIDRMVSPALEDRWKSTAEIRQSLAGILGDLSGSIEEHDEHQAQVGLVLSRMPMHARANYSYQEGYLTLEIKPALGPGLAASILGILLLLSVAALPFLIVVFLLVAIPIVLLGPKFSDFTPRTIKCLANGGVAVHREVLSGDERVVLTRDELSKIFVSEGTFGYDVYALKRGSTKAYLARNRKKEEAEWLQHVLQTQMGHQTPLLE